MNANRRRWHEAQAEVERLRAEVERLTEELAREIELRVEDETITVRRLTEERDRLRRALDAAMQYVDPKDRDWIEALAAGKNA